MKKRLPTVIFIIVILIGLSFLLYPIISDYINHIHQSRAIDEYVIKADALKKDEQDELLKKAYEYNADTANRANPFIPTAAQKKAYEKCLDITGTGMMGYIEIPSINCNLPIYHGTSNNTLQRAIGHIEWTSLPVGGKGTHTVLSGHRGLPSAKLFTNLNKLSTGDFFIIRVLDETLTYEVDQILTVEPEDTLALRIENEKDLCTLVTCTPYGINTHRLLVRGHRTENAAATEAFNITADAVRVEPVITACTIAAILLIILSVYFIVRGKKLTKGE